MVRLSLALFSLPVLAAVASADVHVVSPPVTFNQPGPLQTAINAAAEGDTILLEAGTFQAFHIDGKSLTIRALDPNDRPSIADQGVPPGYFCLIENLSVGQEVLIDGIDVKPYTDDYAATFLNAALTVEDCLGSVRIQDALLRGESGTLFATSGLLVTESWDVVVTASTIRSVSGYCWSDAKGTALCLETVAPAVRIEGTSPFTTRTALFDCTVEGAMGVPPIYDTGIHGIQGSNGFAGSPALSVENAFCFASGSSLIGGSGTDALLAYPDPFAGPTGMGSAGGNGGNAVELTTGEFRHIGSLITAGAPGLGTPCPTCVPVAPPGPDGLPGVGIFGCCDIPVAGTARVTEATVLASGEEAEFTFTGDPGDAVFLTIDSQAAYAYPVTDQGVWALPGFVPDTTGQTPVVVLPASGIATVTVDLPQPAVAPIPQPLFAQAVFVGSNEVRTGSPYAVWRTVDDSLTSYCDSNPNSSGFAAFIGAFGTTSLSENDFRLAAVQTASSSIGQFFYGQTQTAQPFGDGVRCVGGSTFRIHPFTLASPFGDVTLTVDLANAPFGFGPGALAAGETWNFQYWYRDQGSPSGFNLTNGLAARFYP